MTKKSSRFLGANAPLGPASSEGLYVCLYVCLSVCNTLAPLPSQRQRDRETERVAQQLNIFLYQASIISSR